MERIKTILSVALSMWTGILLIYTFEMNPLIGFLMSAVLCRLTSLDGKQKLNGKKLLVLTLPTMPNAWEIFERVKNFPYRYVRRILLFDERESELEMKNYTGQWCPRRKIMLKEIKEEILAKLNGYCWNGFIFRLDEEDYENFYSDMEEYLTGKEIPFIFEHYNLKDVWWGSLAGIFLANITPPLVGFNSAEEFILHKEKITATQREHRFKQILEDVEREKNVSNGQI